MRIDIRGYGTFEKYKKVLAAIIGDSSDKTWLDVCCGDVGVMRDFPAKEMIHVDIFDWNKDLSSRGLPLIPNFHVANALGEHELFTRRYDVVSALDAIEHFTKDDGFKLLNKLDTLGDKQVLFTPLGEYMVEFGNLDPFCHKSGWTPDDVPGYASVVFPEWHAQQLGVGAWFFWKCQDLQADFDRVAAILAKEDLGS